MDATDRQLAHGPLDELPTLLKYCYSFDRLEALTKQIREETDRRLALINDRKFAIRSH